MVNQVVITIGNGSFESGFSVSLLQILLDDKTIRQLENDFQLPPNPEFRRLYDQWQKIYIELGLRERMVGEITGEQINLSKKIEECENVTEELKNNEKNWLRESEFVRIKATILETINEFQTRNRRVGVVIDRVIINTSDTYLCKVSWDYWDLFQVFPQAEFALSSRHEPPTEMWQQPIRILAIFGSDEGGLKLHKDRKLIDNLQIHGAQITSIPPMPPEDNNPLEDKKTLTPRRLFRIIQRENWDIIFYAGHGKGRTLKVNSNESIDIEQLREAFRNAAPTIKLAIFNSCDGQNIAEYLADFNVPNMIVMRGGVPDEVAVSFLEHFLEKFIHGESLHTSVREARKSLHELELDCEDKLFYPRASKIPVLILNPNTPELYWPRFSRDVSPISEIIEEIFIQGYEMLILLSKKTSLLKRIIPFLFLFLFSLLIILFVAPRIKGPEVMPNHISAGGKILLQLKQGEEEEKGKKEGVEKIQQCQKLWNRFLPSGKCFDRFKPRNYWETVVTSLKKAWEEKKDPETLIYLNNAILEGRGLPYHTVAVVVPILDDPERDAEILRGVAQAQTEINKSLFNQNTSSNLTLPKEIVEKINFPQPKSFVKNKGLKVIIADDGNQKGQARDVAKAMVKHPDVLGVIGHWTSDMTMETVDIYNDKKLVMVSPGVSTYLLTEEPRKFFFRTSINNKTRAAKMVDVLINKIDQNKVAIFYSCKNKSSDESCQNNPSQNSPYSGDYKKRLQQEFLNEEDINEEDIIDSFNFSESNFDVQSAMEKIRNSGKLAIALIPDAQVTYSFKNTLKIIRENRGKNWMLGSWTVYSPEILNIAREQPQLLEKLIVITPWHRLSDPDSDFSTTTKELWGPVSARTALSYDAAQVLIEGIRRTKKPKPTKEEIQQMLANPDFEVKGVTGEIKFEEETGDRQEQPIVLVRVCNKKDNSSLVFVPLGYSSTEFNCPIIN